MPLKISDTVSDQHQIIVNTLCNKWFPLSIQVSIAITDKWNHNTEKQLILRPNMVLGLEVDIHVELPGLGWLSYC